MVHPLSNSTVSVQDYLCLTGKLETWKPRCPVTVIVFFPLGVRLPLYVYVQYVYYSTRFFSMRYTVNLCEIPDSNFAINQWNRWAITFLNKPSHINKKWAITSQKWALITPKWVVTSSPNWYITSPKRAITSIKWVIKYHISKMCNHISKMSHHIPKMSHHISKMSHHISNQNEPSHLNRSPNLKICPVSPHTLWLL